MSIHREYYQSGNNPDDLEYDEEIMGTSEISKTSVLVKTQRFIAGISAIIIFFFGIIYLIKIADPDIFHKIMVNFNSSITNSKSKEENQRISRIILLPISNEKQEILINKEVFIGAAKHMVLLSLGEPKSKYNTINKNNENIEQWEYKRPKDGNIITVLSFKNGNLYEIFHKNEERNVTHISQYIRDKKKTKTIDNGNPIIKN